MSSEASESTLAAAEGPPYQVVVLSGPSGVGKSTVVRTLRRAYPSVWVSVSATTRKPRRRERDGVDYYFVDDAEFDQLVETDALLEWATFAGNRYGTPRAPVLEHVELGVPVVLEIDLEGARSVRATLPQALQVFLSPPSWEELERRLTRRQSEPAPVVATRLARGRVELAAEGEFDRTIVNHDVEQVCHELLTLMGLDPA